MIHKQQVGHSLADIVAGLCEALVRNYLNNVGKGKAIVAPVVFQGGVAANAGIRKAFEESLNMPIFVPPHYNVMGALGACYLAQGVKGPSAFRGFAVAESLCRTHTTPCSGCGHLCEVVSFIMDDKAVAHWGDRCGKYSSRREQAGN